MPPDAKSTNSDQFHGGEEVADFEGGGFRGVGAVGAVHLDAGTQVAANRAGRGFLGIGGAHGLTPFGDRTIGFENHGEDFAGGHEVGQFTEERALAVDGVEAAGFFFGEAQGLYGNEFEAGFMDARKNFALQIAAYGIRLDNCKCAFN